MAPPGWLSDRGRECGLERRRWTEAGNTAPDHTCETKGGGLVEWSADDLHAAGQAGRAEPGWHRNGGQPRQVEGRCRPHQRLDHGFGLPVEVIFELVVTLRRGRNRRDEKGIEPLRRERLRDRLLDRAAGSLSAQVERRGKQQ